MDKRDLFFVSKLAEAGVAGNAKTASAYLRQYIEYLKTHDGNEDAESLARIIDKKPAKAVSLARQQGGRIPVDSESAMSIADREMVQRPSGAQLSSSASRLLASREAR